MEASSIVCRSSVACADRDDSVLCEGKLVLNSADISHSISSIFVEVLSACTSGCKACAEAVRTWRVAVLPNKPKIFTFNQVDGEKRRHCEQPGRVDWAIGGAVQIRINAPVAITTMRVTFVKQCDV